MTAMEILMKVDKAVRFSELPIIGWRRRGRGLTVYVSIYWSGYDVAAAVAQSRFSEALLADGIKSVRFVGGWPPDMVQDKVWRW